MAKQKLSHVGKHMRFILLVGDLITLVLFVYVGQRDHGTIRSTNTLLNLLLRSWEFALLWIIIGWPFKVFPPVTDWTPRSLLINLLPAWLMTAPLAVLLRAFVLGRLNIPTLFLAATLGFGFIFLFFWRLLFTLVLWLGARQR